MSKSVKGKSLGLFKISGGSSGYWEGKVDFSSYSKIENLLNSVESRPQGRLRVDLGGLIHSFIKCLLKANSEAGTILGAGEATVNTVPTPGNFTGNIHYDDGTCQGSN